MANDSVNLTVDKEDKWSYKISTGSDGATIYIKAVDAYKQRTIVDYTYKIDAVAPKFEVTQVGENDKPIFKVDEKYTTYASANSLYTRASALYISTDFFKAFFAFITKHLFS